MADKFKFGDELLDALFAFDAGLNAGIAPSLVPSNQLTNAENITVRGTFATHRPPHSIRRISAEGVALLRAALANGKFQGAADFTPEDGPGAKNLTIVLAISGRVFQAILSDSPISIREITIPGDMYPTIFSPNAAQVWMWQSELWLIGNDGSGRAPLIFDNFTARRSKYLREDLGIVAAGSPVAPAIGATITIPLETTYTGPENVVVTICGAQWEIINGSSTDGSYLVTLKNICDASGSVKAAGTPVMLDPSLKAIRVAGNGTCVNGVVAGGLEYGCSGFTGMTLDRAWPGGRGDIVSFGASSQEFTVRLAYTVPAFSTNGQTPCGSGPLIPQECPEYDLWVEGNVGMPACTAVFKKNGNPPPPSMIGELAEDFTPPAQGSTIVTKWKSPYMGSLNQIVLINGQIYEVTATGSTSPGAAVLAKNLNQAPGTAVDAGCHLLTIPELKPGRMGVYGLGRNWYSLVDQTKFRGGDLIGSSSGTAAFKYRDAVLKESSNTFLAESGDFSVPGNVGGITAMRFTATLDASLGQGALQVFTATSAFSCNAPVDNITWPDLQSPILTQSLIGPGAESHWSTINANSDILFRSNVGLASLILARREFTTWGNVPISREVEPIIATDQTDLLMFSSALNFDNRYLITTDPVQSDQGVYHTKLIALNFDPVSSLRGKAPSVYDGPWVGLNILQLIGGRLNNSERAFALCLNTDNVEIEIFELLRATEAIYDNGGQRIVWTGQTAPRFRYAPEQPLARTLKRLHDGEIYVDELIGLVTFEFFYKPDQHPDWIPWFSWSEFSPDGSVNSFRPRMGLGEPSPTPCDAITNRPYREAYTFQVKWIITGHCRLLGGLFKSITIPQQSFAPQVCEEPEVPVIALPAIETALCTNVEYDEELLVPDLEEGEVLWEVLTGSLPPGLIFGGGLLAFDEPATLAGIPTQSGIYTFTVRASFGGIYADRTYQLIVVSINSPNLLPQAVLGVPYSYTLTASPGLSAWSLVIGSGALPPGLSLSSAGIISGTPIGVGSTWNFTVKADATVMGDVYTCQKQFQIVVSATAGESAMQCIPELDEWSVPAGKFVDLIDDGPTLPATIQGNGTVLQMSGSCPPYQGAILSKDSFNLVAGKDYKLSLLVAGNGKNATLPQDGFNHDTCNLEVKLTNGVFQQVLTIGRLDPFTWIEFAGITVSGPTTVEISIISLDPVGPVAVPAPNSSGYGAYLKEIKLENTTDAITLFDNAF